ncbi:MAG: hypothetical protein HQ567_10890 [Candidatus Nealsonbacteria bacterium]|nr:hypothetical protein [Candidatus Nealsonbacteria bacterium]
MAEDHRKSKPNLGFLTVLEHPQHGLFGGYLVLNAAAQPLEFHCTAPIKPNRAQEILYGPTLQSFLYGEQIGRTLLEKSKKSPEFICTDCPPALTVRQHISAPVLLVLPGDDGPGNDDADDEPSRILRLDGAHPGGFDAVRFDASGGRLTTFRLGRNRLAVSEQADDDRRTITEQFGELVESLDLSEPFGRIREAIEEAQQAAR